MDAEADAPPEEGIAIAHQGSGGEDGPTRRSFSIETVDIQLLVAGALAALLVLAIIIIGTVAAFRDELEAAKDFLLPVAVPALTALIGYLAGRDRGSRSSARQVLSESDDF